MYVAWHVRVFIYFYFQGVTIADIDEYTAKTAIRELQGEFGEEKLLFVKTDISNKKEFEGMSILQKLFPGNNIAWL